MRYLKKYITKDWLFKNGFKYNKFLSANNNDIYTYTFPLLQYKNSIILECNLCLHYPEGILLVNVYKSGTTELYAPFYNREYGNFDCSKIDNKITTILKKLGVEKIGE